MKLRCQALKNQGISEWFQVFYYFVFGEIPEQKYEKFEALQKIALATHLLTGNVGLIWRYWRQEYDSDIPACVSITSLITK